MIGTIVNTVAILAGTGIGCALNKKLDTKMLDKCFCALGLCCLVIGMNASVTNISKSDFPTAYILCMVFGTAIGYWPKLEDRVNAKIKENEGGQNLIEGLTLALLLYCIGTMSIVGPMMSALQGDNTFLYTNATLDFVTSIIMATTYGKGMAWAAPILFCWQGAIYLIALLFGPLISDALISDICIVGGVLIISSGLKMLKIKDCQTLNMLPALAVPIIWHLIAAIWK